MKIKPLGKIIILMLIAGAAFGLWKQFGGSLAPGAKDKTSSKPEVGELPKLPDSNTTSTNVPMPGDQTASTGSPEVRFLIWAWNAQMGALFSNGGAQTTEGSLMAKRGVNLKFTRQDDVAKMQEELLAFATDLSRGQAQPSKGTHFVAIMGDGGAAFLQAVNDKLKRLGPDYIAKVVGAIGYSRGEDQFMGLPAWKSDPNSARGGVVAGYLRDGDWNIAMKWLSDNELPNNPDEKTYDPDALNWVSADSYTDAAEKYVSGYSEERPVVRNGKRTGQTKRITVNGVVTWTPGDVTVAQKKGGF
jgi:OmpA-OmpF porin, OOP family